jgi:hypothetical protein
LEIPVKIDEPKRSTSSTSSESSNSENTPLLSSTEPEIYTRPSRNGGRGSSSRLRRESTAVHLSNFESLSCAPASSCANIEPLYEVIFFYI